MALGSDLVAALWCPCRASDDLSTALAAKRGRISCRLDRTEAVRPAH